MGDQDNFQEWVRELADQIGRSVERLAEVDFDELARAYGVDAERARTLADVAGRWLATNAPLFGQGRVPDPDPPRPWRDATSDRSPGGAPPSPGPHPLDLPSPRQGLALSALDSGRWTVRAGSNHLTGTGEGPEPPADAPDLVSELRARDWIASDGTLTLVGHHALARWCRRADDLTPSASAAPPGPGPA